MKEHEFLDGMNSIDSDVVERFIIMDNQLQEKATVKSKTRGKWLRIVAIAACCSIIVSVALIIVPLLTKEDWFDGFDHLTDTFPGDTDIDNGGVGGNKDDVNDNHFPDAPIEQESNAENDGDGNEPNAPIESEDVNERPDFENPDHYEELPGEDMNEPELVLNINIADERYSGYEIPGYFCDPDSVGEKIGEITIEVGYGFELHPARAELYRVEGIDDAFCLCMRYIDSEDSNALDGVLEPDAYYFLWAKSHSFDSLESVWVLKLEEAELNIGSSIGYYKNTNKDYPKNFVLFGGTKKAELVEILLAAKGKSIDAEGGAKVEKVHSEADEIVTLYCNFTSKIGFFHGQIRVYDTGYLYFSTMGGQLFEIGQDVAGDIIYFVTQKCEADGYIREENGDWRPIGAVEDAKYSTLNEAFDENKISGQFSLLKEIGYWENCYGGISPEKLILEARYLLTVAEMLDAADGPVVEIEDITKISNESLVFEQTLGAEARYSIIVYDSGYVWFKEQFYFIDSDASYTSKIFNTVRMNCDAEPYYWNKQKKKWEIGDQDTSVSEDTSPKTSEDYGLGIDETDVDIPYETEIHY